MADFDKVILPGQEGKIEIKITGFKIHPGRFKKSFSVTTNDPENTKVILYVTGIVKKVFDQTKSLSLSGFTNEELRMETVLTGRLEKQVKITGWHWSDKSRDFETLTTLIGVKIEALEVGAKYRVETWTKEGVPAGQYSGDIVLETDFVELPEKMIPFRLVITPDVQLHPNTIIMREMQVPEGTTKSFEKIVSIIAARGDTLKVLEVIPDREDITVNVREVRPGKAYSCRISIRPPTESGKYEGMLKIRTNYKGYEELYAPIKGHVRVTKQ